MITQRDTTTSNNTSKKPEYSDQFIPLFDTPLTATPSLIDVPRPVFTSLYNIIANEFYAHTKCRTEYAIQRIQVLCNPIVWTRYQAEKQLRRRRELERQLHMAANTSRCPAHDNNTRSVMETLSNTPSPFTLTPEELFNDEVLFHGTLKANLPSILANGLDPRLSQRRNNNLSTRTSSIYGAACYFSDSIEKCMRYVDDQTDTEQEYSVLLCAVLLGRVLVEPEDHQARVLSQESFFLPEGYDSAVEQDLFKEWVVFDKAQILPLCVIHFRATNSPCSYLRLLGSDLGHLSRSRTKTITVPVLIPTPAPIPSVSFPSTSSNDTEFIDANSIDSLGEHPMLTDWKMPDPAMALMLKTLLDIPSNLCRVRLYFGGRHSPQLARSSQQQQQHEKTISNKMWIISCPFHLSNGPIGLTHEDMLLLKRISEILKDLDDHQKKHIRLFNELRDTQTQAIEAPLCSVAENDLLLGRWEGLHPLLEREKKGILDLYIDRYKKTHPGDKWRWDDATKNRYQEDIEAAEKRFGDEIVEQSSHRWTAEQVMESFKAFEESTQLMRLKRVDNGRMENERLKLEQERAVQRKFAAGKAEHLGHDYVAELEEGLREYQSLVNAVARCPANASVSQQGQGQPTMAQQHPVMVQSWVDLELSVQHIIYRPQIFVDLYLTSSLLSRFTYATDFSPLLKKARSTTSMLLLQYVDKTYMGIFQVLSTTSSSSPSPQLQQLEWWNIVPMALTQAPTPAPQFWPVNPRSRIPTRSFYHLTEYIDWILHKAYSAAATNILVGTWTGPSEARTKKTAVWETIDPWILPAIQGLSSRSGSIFFNREQREAEINTIQGDILAQLFLKLPESPSLPTATAAAAKTGSQYSELNLDEKWKFARGDCAICSDPMLPIGEDYHNNFNRHCSVRLEWSAIVRMHRCGHCFHENCIREWFSCEYTVLKCPICSIPCAIGSDSSADSRDEFSAEATESSPTSVDGGATSFKCAMKLGPMPDAAMAYTFDVWLCCYIVLFHIPKHTFVVSDNTTTTNRNNSNCAAGHSVTIKEVWRQAIIPFSPRLGPLLLIRLICAFYYGHFFRVGESITRSIDNVVVWNGIHMRTALNGPYGFPAPFFEKECWREVDEKGIAVGLEGILLAANAGTAGGGAGQGSSGTQSQSTLLDRVFSPATALLFS
ncbi:hypothetical protein EC991_010136 [Linnemannia zychae]|nr:hypothetical protein EC991_010136 [Linnemannia zychae]